jgi:hypothetical protein
MKKLFVLLAAALLMAIAVPAVFAEVELGLSGTPLADPLTKVVDTSTGFHVGYNWSVLYLSWDAIAVHSGFVSSQTGFWNGNNWVSGPYSPGFLNLFDAGLILTLRPFVIYTEIGTNTLYVYPGTSNSSFGANLRLGAGLRFGFWGVNVSGTAVFPDLNTLGATLSKLASPVTSNQAISAITDALVPSLNLTFYF